MLDSGVLCESTIAFHKFIMPRKTSIKRKLDEFIGANDNNSGASKYPRVVYSGYVPPIKSSKSRKFKHRGYKRFYRRKKMY